MGGAVGFESQPGRGSTFWVEIPLKTSSSATVGESAKVLVPPVSSFYVGPTGVLSRALSQYATEWNSSLVEIADWTASDGRSLVSRSPLSAASPSPTPSSVALSESSPTSSEVLSAPKPARAESLPVMFVSLDTALDDAVIADLASLLQARATRIVYVSRESLDDVSKKLRELDVDGILGEPFRREQLTSILNGTSNVVPLSPLTVAPEKQESALILLVEDNPTNQLLAELFLAELGHRTHTVANGREAVEALSRIPYDLVLMDCQMPVMDGFEATRLIREREGKLGQGHHIPIVAMTANALASDKERCFAAGMDDFLAKPFQASDLSGKLRRWIKIETRGAVDWAILHDLALKTNATVVSRLIQSFLKTLPASLSEIRKALAENDPQALRAWAHQLKSSSASLGALELNAFCLRLEEAIESKSSMNVIEAAAKDLLANGETALAEFQSQTRYA